MIVGRSWVAMPVTGSGQANDPVRAKYPVEGDALLVHRHGEIYITFANDEARDRALRNPESRLLTGEEGFQFEATLPFASLPLVMSGDHRSGRAPLPGGNGRCRTCRD